MPTKAIKKFVAEILDLYRPPLRRKGTYDKIAQVLREIGELGVVKTTTDINPKVIALWVRSHQDRRPVTNHSLLRPLRAATRYAQMMGYIKSDPFQWRAPAAWLNLQDGKEHVAWDRHRSCHEILKVLARADFEAAFGEWQAMRLQALIYFFAFTAMRKKEVLGLCVKDISINERIIHIRNNQRRQLKTQKSAQILGIVDPLAAILTQWLPLTGCQWVFPGIRREGPWLHGGPGVRALDHVKALGERAGVKGLTLLGFRHTFGTLAEGWGFGETEIQRWMRHARRSTQDAYRHPDIDVIQKAMRKIDYSAFEARSVSAPVGGPENRIEGAFWPHSEN